MERIKYFSINDIAYGSNLKNIQDVLSRYKGKIELNNVNDLLEIYNIKKYLDKKVFLIDSDVIDEYHSIMDRCYGTVAKYFNSICDDNFEMIYKDVDIEYIDDFWELIEIFKCYLNISSNAFCVFINANGNACIYEIVRNKKLIEYYGSVIRGFMIKSNSIAELLLDKYELKHITESKAIHLPKELSNKDKEIIINNYLENDEANLNYLKLIVNVQSNKDKLELSPRTILKAKKKSEEEENKFFEKNTGILMETSVTFSKKQDEEVKIDLIGQSLAASYSSKWIEENMDYPTLFNNFIYLFIIIIQ